MLRKLKIFGIIVLGICLFSCSMESTLPSVEESLLSVKGSQGEEVSQGEQKPAQGEEVAQAESKPSQGEGIVQVESKPSSSEKQTDVVIFPSWYSEADIRVHYQTMEEAVENSVVYLINKDISSWYYYNKMKEDRFRPYRKVAYEIAIKMICNGAFLPGYEYPTYHIADPSVQFPGNSLLVALRDVWRAVLYDHPEFFYLTTRPSGCDVLDHETGVKAVEFYKQKDSSLEMLQQEEQELLAAAQQMLKRLDTSLSTDQQLDDLFDIIVDEVSYFHNDNGDQRQVFTAWGGIVDKKTCCQGYSLAYQYLAYLAGIDATVFTVYGMNGTHAWNYIQTSNGLIPIDTTWKTWNEFKSLYEVSWDYVSW